ncbi:MAG: hypothetical protein J7M25_06815 [Deltaproteobacteria bacterium]|nr:hypothetical protein [Deltaproteobacteria bacterium]
MHRSNKINVTIHRPYKVKMWSDRLPWLALIAGSALWVMVPGASSPAWADQPGPSAGGPAFEGMPPASVQSMHQYELWRHRGEAPAPRVWTSPLDRTTQRQAGPKGRRNMKAKQVQRIVYGYFPYWVSDLDAIQWDRLTHIAYFAVELTSAGAVSATHGWPDQAVIDAATSTGTTLDVTFTLFSASGIATLCGSTTNRAAAIDSIIAQMEAGPADGVSIDFESPNSATRENFVLFIHELRAALDARGHQGAEISIAGTAWSSIGGIDLDALLDDADIYFIMGYPYFGSWSSRAGPVGKLRTAGSWASVSSLSAARTIAAYAKMVSADKRHQVVHGVPYYGWHWVTADDQPGSTATSSVGAIFYSAARDAVAGGRTRRWDIDVLNPWYAWQDTSWNQVWYDDEESLAAKYQLVLEQDLGGIGIWALDYDVGYSDLWDLIGQAFGQEPTPQDGDRFQPIRIDTFPFHDARDTNQAPSNYFDFYSCSPDTAEYGREWVYRMDLCQPGHVTAHVPQYSDRDPDLHLLTGPTQDDCIARADQDLALDVQPGMYLLTVDSWVDSHDIQKAGPYDLDVDFAPDPNSQPCRDDQVCDQGTCACPDDLSDCDGACVDTSQDPNHCGSCDRVCDPGAQCQNGDCVSDQVDDGGMDSGRMGDGGSADASQLPCCGCPDKGGCSCRTATTGRRGQWPLGSGLFVTILFGLFWWRRRRQ